MVTKRGETDANKKKILESNMKKERTKERKKEGNKERKKKRKKISPWQMCCIT